MEVPIQTTKPSGSASRRVTALAVVLALAAVGWFVWHIQKTGFDWAKFRASLSQMHPGWMALAIAFSLLTYPGRALRWRVLIRPVREHPSFWRILDATVIGFTAIVLFGRAGEMVRPYLIAVKEKVPFSSQIAAWLLERVYDLLVVLLIFGFALTQIQGEDTSSLGASLQWVLRTGGYITGFICLFCVFILLGMRWFSGALEQRFLDSLSFLPAEYFTKIEQLAKAFSAGVRSTRSGAFTLLIFLYTFVEWVVIFASNYSLFQALPATADLTAQQILVYLAFVAFGSAIQIPGIGGGMQVASVLVLTEMFGLSLEAATGVSVLIWLATYVIVVPAGILLALREGLNWRKLKGLGAESPT